MKVEFPRHEAAEGSPALNAVGWAFVCFAMVALLFLPSVVL